MSGDTLDAEATLRGGGEPGDGRAEDPPALALTILHHPDPGRVGDLAILGTGCALSRIEPSFRSPAGGGGAPLADRHLSRRPLAITALGGGGVRLEPGEGGSEIAVDGQRLASAVELDPERVAHGITLECAGRVALLLHARRPPRGGVQRHGLIGHSEAIETACLRVDQVAGLEVPVLLTGPTGSGKELIARAIHQASHRSAGPFVAVNAATLPASTAASQLFGHLRGAFTGADRASAGLVAAADGGTLFLDEIGETSPEVQAMLLRALEEKSVLPLGAVAARPVDVRLVAASDADLEAAAAAGTFKLPLLHRLGGFRIRLPALAERRDDVGRLLLHFLREELAAAGEPDRLAPRPDDQSMWLPPSLVAGMARHGWPGNVRELRNVARHIVISNRYSPTIAIDETLAALGRAGQRPLPARPPTRRPGEIGEEDLVAALRANRWQTSATAAQLGISRTTLYALMDRSDSIRKGRDLSAADIRDAHHRAGGDVERMAEILEVSERALRLRIRELRLDLS